MSAPPPPPTALDHALGHSYVDELTGLGERWAPAPAPAPRLLVLNDDLARELGIDPAALAAPAGLAVLAGNAVPAGAEPVAQAYAGHQFGGLSPRLGDGRAILLGELVDVHGRRRDLHLKGSGRTPFARGGDGKAAVGPMLREHVMGEAMHALGIPTTRALAVVATGEQVLRETPLPGAVLARVAASHLRVGTFQYAAMREDPSLLRRLADHALRRHHPELVDRDEAHLGLFRAVVEAQADLVASWMLVGFVHGVMNTDNTTISGETIDYGPCAFMEAYDPATVFSSIDHGGRYAYGNQPLIAQWNLARLAEAMLPLFAAEPEPAVAAATPVLEGFVDRYLDRWAAGTRAKLGLVDERAGTRQLVDDLLGLLEAQQVDWTSCFRALGTAAAGDAARARALFRDAAAFDAWAQRWHAELAAEGREPAEVRAGMDRTNPVHIPRNHLVEEALDAATAGDLGPYRRLVDVVVRPFDDVPGLERYAEPAPAGGPRHRTFCGT